MQYQVGGSSWEQYGLQQQSKVKLWGWAEPEEMIYITTSWNNKTDSVKTTRDANWQLFVETPAAGRPFTITFKGQNTITLDNVLIGEVWICRPVEYGNE